MWFGNLISFVSWLPPFALAFTFGPFGDAESWSTMKAPFTLIFTEPGCVIVLSISAVLVRMRRGEDLGVVEGLSAFSTESTPPSAEDDSA